MWWLISHFKKKCISQILRFTTPHFPNLLVISLFHHATYSLLTIETAGLHFFFLIVHFLLYFYNYHSFPLYPLPPTFLTDQELKAHVKLCDMLQWQNSGMISGILELRQRYVLLSNPDWCQEILINADGKTVENQNCFAIILLNCFQQNIN